jgi:Domain of unknown function (DUF4345)
MDQEAGALKACGRTERLALQIAVAIAGLVPVTAGASAIAIGPGFLDIAGPAPALTHAAYLSGLLLGIGIAFWSLIPGIERQGRVFALLTAIVVLGGLARAYTALKLGVAGNAVLLPLAMELLVTPALWLWQRRIAKAA